jgi:hypothetical protein
MWLPARAGISTCAKARARRARGSCSVARRTPTSRSYLSLPDLERLLSLSRAKLRPAGRLVIADIIPRDIGALTDAVALLRFAGANGFLVPAAIGLVRSFFSSYRRVRAALGLLRFDENEMIQVLHRAGFSARRHRPNIGHNAKRMTFVAQPSAPAR